MTIRNAKQCLREEVIPALRERTPYFDIAAIRYVLLEKGVHVERETLNRYLYELEGKSQIYSAGRGWYSTIEQEFRPYTEPVAEIIATLEKQFPLLEFSCWSTQQINQFMHHLLGKFVTFIHVDRDLMSSAFDFLRDREGMTVYLDPSTKDERDKFRVDENTVVIRPAVTGAPGKGHAAPIEKILVDLAIEVDQLPLMDRAEFQEMACRAATAGRISMAALIRYARRRNQGPDDIFGAGNLLTTNNAKK